MIGRRRGRRFRLSRRLLWTAVLVVLAAGLAKLYGPLSLHRAQQQELARLRLQKAELVAEQARLERHKNRLASEEGLEAAARREGYVRPGERRIVFVPAPRGRAPAAEKDTQGKLSPK